MINCGHCNQVNILTFCHYMLNVQLYKLTMPKYIYLFINAACSIQLIHLFSQNYINGTRGGFIYISYDIYNDIYKQSE